MPSLFTEIDMLKTRNKELKLKLEKYNYYKNKCSHLKTKLRKLRARYDKITPWLP